MIGEGEYDEYTVVGLCDDDHLPAVVERCKKIPGMEVDLDSPLTLNAAGFLADAEHAIRRLDTYRRPGRFRG
jgi:predicted nuclease with RNAse H fold